MKFLRKIPKNSRNSNLPEDPRSQKEARRGATPGPGNQRARPGGWPRHLAAWPGGVTPRPPLAYIFTPDRKPSEHRSYLQFPSRSRRHLCSSSGELIWRLFWPPVRGIHRHRHHHHHSIIPPCFPHTCVSTSLL